MKSRQEVLQNLKNKADLLDNENKLFYRKEIFIESLYEIWDQAKVLDDEQSAIVQTVVEDTAAMVDQLKQENADHKKVMIEYGKKMLGYILNNKDNMTLFAISFDIDQLLFEGLGLKLHSLDLYDLDEEIERAKFIHNESTDKQIRHQNFINSLLELRKTIHEDLEVKSNASKNWAWEKESSFTREEIRASEANMLAKDATAMLKNLKYQKDTKESDKNYLEEFGKKYQRPAPSSTNFFKAAWSVAITGLGYVVGGTFGFLAGIFAEGLVFSPIEASDTAFKWAVKAIEYTSDFGKWSTGLDKFAPIKNMLFFQPEPIAGAGMKVSKNGAEFIEPTPKSESSSEQGDRHRVDYELLAKYHMGK